MEQPSDWSNFRKTDWPEYRKRLTEVFNNDRDDAWKAYYKNTALPFNEEVVSTALEASSILIKKHQDYGPDNINNAPGGAMNGLLVRMHDKMERLKTLLFSNREPNYESIEDTLLDLINYSIIGLMVQREKWPK